MTIKKMTQPALSVEKMESIAAQYDRRADEAEKRGWTHKANRLRTHAQTFHNAASHWRGRGH